MADPTCNTRENSREALELFNNVYKEHTSCLQVAREGRERVTHWVHIWREGEKPTPIKETCSGAKYEDSFLRFANL